MLNSTTEQNAEPHRSRHLVLMLAGVAAVLLATLLLRSPTPESRVLDELEAIAARGEPVLPGDLLASMPAGDPATRAWLEEYEGLPASWRDAIFGGDGSPEDALLAASQTGSGPRAEALSSAWAECLRQDPDAARFLDREWVEGLLDSQPNPAGLTECERHALWIWFEVSGAKYEWAMRASEFGAIDQAGSIQAIVDAEEAGIIFPWFPIPGLIEACSILLESASIAAFEGDSTRLLDHLSRALHVAEMARGQAWCVGNLAYFQAMSRVLEGLERNLAYLPRDADVSFLEEFLLAWDPQAEMRAALLGERAILTLLFERIQSDAYGELDDEFLGGSGTFSRPPSLHELTLDQLAYMEVLSIILAELEKDQFDSSEAALHEVEAILSTRPASRMLPYFVMPASEMHQTVLEMDVRRRLALHALQAHRNGIESVVPAIERDADPFSGGRLRVRIDPDGSWILWSTGADGVDHGGAWKQDADAPNDLVWRYRALTRDR